MVHATLTSRIRAQDVIDSYQISQALLKERYPRWSTISSVQITGPDASVVNRVRTVASESIRDARELNTRIEDFDRG